MKTKWARWVNKSCTVLCPLLHANMKTAAAHGNFVKMQHTNVLLLTNITRVTVLQTSRYKKQNSSIKREEHNGILFC